jgi:hypothetical protein
MAVLANSTVTTLTATTSATSNVILCTATSSIQQWAGQVGVQTPYYDPVNNYVDLLGNNNGYNWITGIVEVGAYQSYNSSHQFMFALSRYGVKTSTGPTFDGLMSLSHYQDPNNANINYLRVTNLYNASWAYGYYQFNCIIFSGSSSSSVISSVLSRIN